MSSLQALDSLNVTSKTVLKTARSLNNLASKIRQLNLCWIKAHVGHEGNKQADKLARDATMLISTERLHESKCIRKEILTKKIYEMWANQWQPDPTCRQTKQFFEKPDPVQSKKILKLARSKLSTLVKITTGHNNFSYHASHIDPTIDPTCGLCGESMETFFHFVSDCPRLRLTRQDIGLREEDRGTWTPERLLELARVPAVEALLNRF